MRIEIAEWNKKKAIISEIDIDWREKMKICSEINTNYTKYKGNKFCVHVSYDFNDNSYAYYFMNYGFDDYLFFAKRIVD